MSDTNGLKLGMIGLDTSHSVEFAARLHDPSHPHHVPGGRITIACPTMSPDIPWSADRHARFTDELKNDHGVRLAPTIGDMIGECDAVLLCSLDGRPHPEQFRQCAVGKPVFVDKPVAASLRDAMKIYDHARVTQTPVFSASAVRWFPGVRDVAETDVGTVRSAISWGPAPIDPHHPDLFFYGIHPVEALFTVLGAGCKSARRTTSEAVSVVVGEWNDGRVGLLHALHRWPADYKVVKFGDSGVAEQSRGGDYADLLRVIMTFFQTGTPPLSETETLEILAFMEAADESKRRGGDEVSIAETMAQASLIQ